MKTITINEIKLEVPESEVDIVKKAILFNDLSNVYSRMSEAIKLTCCSIEQISRLFDPYFRIIEFGQSILTQEQKDKLINFGTL